MSAARLKGLDMTPTWAGAVCPSSFSLLSIKAQCSWKMRPVCELRKMARAADKWRPTLQRNGGEIMSAVNFVHWWSWLCRLPSPTPS